MGGTALKAARRWPARTWLASWRRFYSSTRLPHQRRCLNAFRAQRCEGFSPARPIRTTTCCKSSPRTPRRRRRLRSRPAQSRVPTKSRSPLCPMNGLGTSSTGRSRSKASRSSPALTRAARAVWMAGERTPSPSTTRMVTVRCHAARSCGKLRAVPAQHRTPLRTALEPSTTHTNACLGQSLTRRPHPPCATPRRPLRSGGAGLI
mmetsp:Transcript_16238/g.42034  ORF Transcript_16238/g.42034 Transcript_16238/m.42034 type:complete len:205 (+) Transcript_16238:982-1596(+)